MFSLLQSLGLFSDSVLDSVMLRATFAGLIAFILSSFGTYGMIRYCRHAQVGQAIRKDGPTSHLQKQGTPTMGGVAVILALSIALICVSDLRSGILWSVWLSTVAFAVIGFVDDWAKWKKTSSKGLSGKYKLFFQSVVLIVFLVLFTGSFSSAASPFTSVLAHFFLQHLGNIVGMIGIWLLAWFMVVGTSNAVNLTDGLDGLAAFPIVLVSLAMGYLFYTGHLVHLLSYTTHSYQYAELPVFCVALSGAVLGFLWFNSFPAQIFMGDVGSLSCGGALGVLGVCLQKEVIFLCLVSVFFIEAVSVIAQVASFKLRKKRVFLMAPLHHHFELTGCPESKVVVRGWILSVLSVGIALFLAARFC